MLANIKNILGKFQTINRKILTYQEELLLSAQEKALSISPLA